MPEVRDIENGAPLTGAKVLTILGVFFAVMFSVDGLMAYDAISTFRGEVARHPYEDGLAYNKQIAAAEAQTERRWKVDVTLAGAVRATFRDAEGAQLAGLDVTGVFASPTDTHRDRVFAMREIGPGVYVSDVSPSPGLWDLKLQAGRDGQNLFLSQNRVSLP